MRFALVIILLGTVPVISGCSRGYYVDPADFGARRPAVSERAAAPERTPAQVVRRSRAEPVATARQDDSEITGTIGSSSSQVSPWPKRGTPEFNRLQAEEAERDRRIDQMLRTGICSGC
jgi:hypothetical protein